MKLALPFLSLLLSSIFLLPACAQPLTPITADSPQTTAKGQPNVNCRVPIAQIGELTLSDTFAVIHNGLMEVCETSMPANVDPLLRGRVVKFDQTGIAPDGTRKLSGLVLFYGGSMLGQLAASATAANDALDRSHMDDLIFRKQGALSGHIAACSSTAVTVASREGLERIPLDSVTYVRSPHAFVFTLSGQLSADKSHTKPDSISFRTTMGSEKLGESLVAGHRPDSIDGLLDDSNDPAPKPILVPNYNVWGAPGGKPFGNWP